LELAWETADPTLAFHVGVGVNRADEVEVCSFATHLDGLPARTGAREHTARLLVPELPLVKGEFKVYVFLLDEAGLHVYDQRVIPRAFSVESASYSFGLVAVAHAWDMDARPASSVDRVDGSEAKARR
jgi:lipopolysaccharide transport system ATP-binding protein